MIIASNNITDGNRIIAFLWPLILYKIVTLKLPYINILNKGEIYPHML